MSENSDISIHLTEDEKEQFEDILSTMGYTVEDAIHIFIKKVIKDKTMPFDITDDVVSEDEDDILGHDDIWL